MTFEQILQAIGALTVTSAVALAVVGFLLDIIRVSKSEDRRFDAYAKERDKREALIVAERDEWKRIAQLEQQKREEGDERLERITDAFETAYRIVAGGGGGFSEPK